MAYYLTENELYHHGVKGQKWGERRWQNEDGSLTTAGREHYGYGSVKGGAYRLASKVYGLNEKAYNKLGNKTLASMNKAAKNDMLKKAEVADKKQADWKQQRKDYIKTKSTGEKLATGLLLGPYGLYTYNSLMAAGSSGGNKLANFGKAAATTYLTGGLGNVVYSTIIANKEKTKYSINS